MLPLFSVFLRIVQDLIARDTENTAVFQLFGKRDDVKVKETKLTLVPVLGWVRLGSPCPVRQEQFLEEALVPLAVDVPVLLYKKTRGKSQEYRLLRRPKRIKNEQLERHTCMVCATSEAWIKCSMTTVKYKRVSLQLLQRGANEMHNFLKTYLLPCD